MTSKDVENELHFIRSNMDSSWLRCICTPNFIIRDVRDFYVKMSGTNQYLIGTQYPLRGLEDLEDNSPEKNEMLDFNSYFHQAVHISNGEWLVGSRHFGFYCLQFVNKPITSCLVDLMDYIKVVPCRLEDLPSKERSIFLSMDEYMTNVSVLIKEPEPQTDFDMPNWSCTLQARINYLNAILPELKKKEAHDAWLASLSVEERSAYIREEQRKEEAKREAIRKEEKEKRAAKEAEKLAQKEKKKRKRKIMWGIWSVWALCLVFFTFNLGGFMEYEWYDYVLGFLGSALAIIVPIGVSIYVNWD